MPDFFRGLSSLSNAVQAARAFARDTLGETRTPAWRPMDEQVDDDGSMWGIVLSAPRRLLQVNLNQTWSEPLLSTCATVKRAPVREFSLDSVELLCSEGQEWSTL